MAFYRGTGDVDSGATAWRFSDVDAAAVAAYAATAAAYAATATAQAGIATAAKTAAESARDAALIQAGVYVDEPTGRAAVADGVAFKVQGSGNVAAYEYRRVNAGSSTLIATYPSSVRVEDIGTRTVDIYNDTAPGYVHAIQDTAGYTALGVRDDGTVEVPALLQNNVKLPGITETIEPDTASDFVYGIADSAGNLAFGVRDDGTVFPEQAAAQAASWTELTIGVDDSIVHIGDSYTAAHYVLKDKAYISQLSALSPYRHQNFGVSGNDALDMQYRIVNQSSYGGLTFSDMKARYAFITTYTNDGQFYLADWTYYAENVRRLVEMVRSEGVEPVITTEFPVVAEGHAQLRRIADEAGCAFIDCTSYNAEAGGLDVGPFHQGHPGTRTGAVFWLPMLDFIDRMPKPDRAIKIFRRRSTFAVGAIAELLYKDRSDRNKKWKEITVAHYSLTPEAKFEELSALGTVGVDFNYAWQDDEYQRLVAGSAVAFTDYALMEITLPGTAMTLDAVELTLTTTSSPTVYARNFLDVTASLPGRAQGSTPTDPTYLSKWDLPRGAWRSLGAYSAPIVIPKSDLRRSMQGDKLVIMVAGAFSLTGLKIRYQGRDLKSDLRVTAKPPVLGAELLAQQFCGTAPQLAAWAQTGTVATLVPIDQSMAPRKLAVDTPVDGVCTISSANTIGQAVTLPAETGALRRFRLTVWARYFPKAFLDPTLYPALDANQIIDRIANPTLAPITTDTADLRTLKCELWAGSGAYPANGGAEFFDFAPLWWRPVEFTFEAPAFLAGASFSFRLSCPDGEIQIGKASCKEIQS